MVEAARIVEEGIASVEDVNKACVLAFNHAMGPLDTADLSGLDTVQHVAEGLVQNFGDRFLPHADAASPRQRRPLRAQDRTRLPHLRRGDLGVSLRERFDLSGQTAIVTGGGSGLGLQMAEALAELGAGVVVCARKAERCEEAAAALTAAYGVETLGLGCDVRDRAQIDAVVAATLERFGAIDVLVNNSGTTWGAPAAELPLEAWQKVIDVNLTGLFSFTQAAGRVMIEQRRGSIVNNASIAAFVGESPEAMDAVSYSASKGAVVSFTRDLAVKWARYGIRVNALAPGWFPSEMSEHTLSHSGSLLLRPDSDGALRRRRRAQGRRGAARVRRRVVHDRQRRRRRRRSDRLVRRRLRLAPPVTLSRRPSPGGGGRERASAGEQATPASAKSA